MVRPELVLARIELSLCRPLSSRSSFNLLLFSSLFSILVWVVIALVFKSVRWCQNLPAFPLCRMNATWLKRVFLFSEHPPLQHHKAIRDLPAGFAWLFRRRVVASSGRHCVERSLNWRAE